ncbi:GyrI-like domain-containing protein [Polaromonas sp. P1(28)-13]|nr:GyrI-like domain-containing protein [Polaromonas sp. P1-6]UUZ70312.1 GyrI-like domain-containing protein [Polaromonas sp. P2-4]UUZ78285.1 GyrI-like domain-containing protein [Polaromonas sp. P1(28)-13]
MQPTRQTLAAAFPVSGITVRTTNQSERDPQTAKLAAHWGRFFVEGLFDKIPGRLPDSGMYGVYSAYESDHTGAFDVTAGAAVSALGASAPWRGVEIQAGKYLVFTAKGAMPQVVVQTWGVIWQFFQDHPEIQRSYATDFEAYHGPDEVAVHIGIHV